MINQIRQLALLVTLVSVTTYVPLHAIAQNRPLPLTGSLVDAKEKPIADEVVIFEATNACQSPCSCDKGACTGSGGCDDKVCLNGAVARTDAKGQFSVILAPHTYDVYLRCVQPGSRIQQVAVSKEQKTPIVLRRNY